jgi:hypothetical protein
LKFIIDKYKIKEGEKNRAYDERGLTICKCGKHKYPSKKMIYDWLKNNYSDVNGIAEIWSISDGVTGEVTIGLEIKYEIPKESTMSRVGKQ